MGKPSVEPILLLEDDLVDAMTIRRVLKELGVMHPVVHAGDGEEGLGYLRDPDNQRPFLTLVDINMPRMNGIEFLEEVKRDAGLKSLPMVILTTSDQDQDKAATFGLGAAGYIVKPVDYKKFIDTMRVVNDYWELSQAP